MRRITLIIAAFLILTNSRAQSNSNAIGIRLSTDNENGFFGFTYKHSLNSKTQLEGILQFTNSTVTLSGLYEKYNAFPNVRNLNWFYGGGVLLGFGDDGVKGGIAGALGLSFNIPDVPVEISFDWMPHLVFPNSHPFDPAILGLSGRYTF